jgi:hypothetical protein
MFAEITKTKSLGTKIYRDVSSRKERENQLINTS